MRIIEIIHLQPFKLMKSDQGLGRIGKIADVASKKKVSMSEKAGMLSSVLSWSVW